MATVKTYKELEKALMKARDKALKGTGENTKDLVKDRIDKDVYMAGNPTKYERTYELRESVQPSKVESKGSIAEVTIGHDESLIGSYSPNQHYSIIDGSSSVHSIAEIVHDGKSGHILGAGYWTKKRPYMDNTKKEMKDGKYKDFMVEELKKQGLDAK